MFNHSNIKYNPLQLETAKYVNEDCNLVVLAPTSSGKTIVAEQIFNSTRGRCLYLCPFKSLTNEKLLDWKDVDSKVAITGDHKQIHAVKEDLVLMTTESLDSKSRSGVKWLREVKTIVADEAHLLAMDNRGDAFEVGLTRTCQITDARIVFLSATMPNTHELAEWLTTLNGKPTKVVETEWRPIELVYQFYETSSYEWEFNTDAKRICQQIVNRNPDSSILVFVHSIAKGEMISGALNCPFHCSRKSVAIRHKLEKDFRERGLRVLVSTSTLAYGINMPCDIGIIVGGHRGYAMVEMFDIKQMTGRIGRYGLTEKGTVYYILKSVDYERVTEGLYSNEPVKSVLADRLYFHICSFVAREHMVYDEILSLLKNTLAWQQKRVTAETLDRAIEKLQMYEILGEDMSPSPIARASAFMYVDPIDLWHMRKHFKDRPSGPILIAKAFSEVPSMAYEITLPKAQIDWIECEYTAQTALATALYYWLLGEELPQGLGYLKAQFILDLPRWLSALKMAGFDAQYASKLEIIVLNGVPESAAELVTIPGIGRVKAMRLINAGITTKQDLLNNKLLGVQILGQKLYYQVSTFVDEGKIILYF
jgi:helicase